MLHEYGMRGGMHKCRGLTDGSALVSRSVSRVGSPSAPAPRPVRLRPGCCGLCYGLPAGGGADMALYLRLWYVANAYSCNAKPRELFSLASLDYKHYTGDKGSVTDRQ